MKNSKGGIEMLLLLCCVVGVVAFFCFSLGIASLLQQVPEAPELQEKLNALLKEKEQKELLFKELGDEKKELERQKKEELKARAGTGKLTETQLRNLEQELKEVKKERNRMDQEIKKRRKELAGLYNLPDPKKREKKERELQELQEKLEELRRRIEEKMDLLAQAEVAWKGDSFTITEESLRKELANLRGKKDNLGREVSRLKTKTLWGGSSQFINPLFVDCRKNAYIFYPEGEAVATMEIEKRNIFEKRAQGHDIIVLLVRPEGYESFEKAYARVKAISIARSYEPVKSAENLDFLREER